MEQEYNIPIIFQDHHLLIVNKPAWLVIHPTYKHADGTLWNALLKYLAELGSDDWSAPDLPDGPGWEHAPEEVRLMLRARRLEKFCAEEGLLPRPVLLHRLDKDTSGVVALARTAKSCRHVARQFSSHTVRKTYLAVAQRVAPAWTRPRAPFTIHRLSAGQEMEQCVWPLDLTGYKNVPLLLNGSLQRDPDDRRRCVVGPDGQEARTRITVLEETEDFLLVEACPITGRTHQIRAHLAAAGFALVGDSTYAPVPDPDSPQEMLARQFLHAFSLTLKDYPTDRLRTFVAPLPSELMEWLTQYFPAARDAIDARQTNYTLSGEDQPLYVS